MVIALGSDIGTFTSNPKVHILLEVSVHKRVPFLRFFPDSAAGVLSELCLLSILHFHAAATAFRCIGSFALQETMSGISEMRSLLHCRDPSKVVFHAAKFCAFRPFQKSLRRNIIPTLSPLFSW